jgi:hypothetical protein
VPATSRYRARTCARLAVLVPLALSLRGAAAQDANVPSASSVLYVRADTDRTTVITPRLHVGVPLAEETRLDLVYTADVWTSASIDIRTSASRVVGGEDAQPVTEQRDEINVGLGHAFTDLSLSGGYRYSTEYDYESHGGSLGVAYDFADSNAQIALGVRAYFDRVGRAGDPGFEREAEQLSARASFTQVLDRQTVAQVVYELTRQQGYLSSPYRYVRIANDVGSLPSRCAYSTTMFEPRTLEACAPENNPSERLRHAMAVSARRALGDALSAGANYRFYIDDWGMTSHTINVDGALVPGGDYLIGLAYRFYVQGQAAHFAPYYPTMPLPDHYTSDKELSKLMSHRLALEIERRFVLDDLGSELRAVLTGAPSHYMYINFLPLDHITALEVTFALEVRL